MILNSFCRFKIDINSLATSNRLVKPLQTILKNGKLSSSTIFGKGESGNKIAEILYQLPLIVEKQIQY